MYQKYNLEMKNLHFRESFKNFLYDLENFITIYENNLHVFNYKKLEKLSDTEIVIKVDNKKLKISGINMKIKQMTKQELLINGDILKVEFLYE